MNNTIKILLAFALGCAAGAAVTDICLKKKYTKQLEDAVAKYDEQHKTDDIQEDKPEQNSNPAVPEENADIMAKTTLEREDYTRFVRNNPYGVLTRDNAEDILVKEEHPQDDDEEEPEEAHESHEMKSVTEAINKAKAPKIIRASDYGEMPYLDKRTLYYYKEDGVLTTEEDEVIHDIWEIVGDCLRKYGFADNDEGTLYVRNLKRGSDYEIIKIDGEFPGDSQY